MAVQQARRGRGLRDLAAEINVHDTTLSRIERGTHRPSVDTARALAAWLGWTLEQVLEAAERPAAPPVE